MANPGSRRTAHSPTVSVASTWPASLVPQRSRPWFPTPCCPPHTWHSWVGHPGPTLHPICYPPLSCTIKYLASRVSVSLLPPNRASPSLPGFSLSFPGFHLFAPRHSFPLRRSPLFLPLGRSSLPSAQLFLLRYWFCSDFTFIFFLLAVRWRLHQPLRVLPVQLPSVYIYFWSAFEDDQTHIWFSLCVTLFFVFFHVCLDVICPSSCLILFLIFLLGVQSARGERNPSSRHVFESSKAIWTSPVC